MACVLPKRHCSPPSGVVTVIVDGDIVKLLSEESDTAGSVTLVILTL
jgi:hypothetical protein